MSAERKIRRSNQEVFFTDEQEELQPHLKNIFSRSTLLFAVAQNLFPETRMISQEHFNIPHRGNSQIGHDFTFNFGLIEPRSVPIYGERDYVLEDVYTRFIDDFFRFTFNISLTEEELAALDRDKLLTHTPKFFIQRDDLGGFESGISWIPKAEGERDLWGGPPIKREQFQAPVPFLKKVFGYINRPIAGVNTYLVNQEVFDQLAHGLPINELPYYPDTKKSEGE